LHGEAEALQRCLADPRILAAVEREAIKVTDETRELALLPLAVEQLHDLFVGHGQDLAGFEARLVEFVF